MRLPKRASKRRSERSRARRPDVSEPSREGADPDAEAPGRDDTGGRGTPSERRSRGAAAPTGPVAGRLAGIGVALLRGLAALATRGAGALAGRTAPLRRRAEAILAAASRLLTPTRALLIAAIGCAALLGLAQFADYRGVAIGADAYAGIESVAPAPEVDRKELGTAHAYALLPAALLAIAVLAVATRSRRWRLCRLAILVGLAAIAVTVLIDRPAGLDEGFAARDFADAEAKLLGGFWAQLFAGVGLVLTSALLAREIRRAGRPAGSSSRARRPKGRTMSVATAAGQTGAGGAEA